MAKPDYRHFYEKHVDKIYRYIHLRVGGDREIAEDLCSEVFLKALEAYDRYDPSISASAWIYTIARNHLANWYRRNSKTRGNVSTDDIQIAATDFHEGVFKEEERERLSAGLAALDGEKEQLIRMKYLEGYDYQEMSEILGKTSGALKVATHRAMRQLAQHLQS